MPSMPRELTQERCKDEPACRTTGEGAPIRGVDG